MPGPGGDIWWEQHGSGPRTPLLVLHGGPGAAHHYLRSLSRLADERPVIFYDQAGCGRSAIPQNPALYGSQRFVDEIEAVRATLGLERVSLYGHGWGATLALEYLLSGERQGIEKLILASATASSRQRAAGRRLLMRAIPDGSGLLLLALEDCAKTDTTEYWELRDIFETRHVLRTVPTASYRSSVIEYATSPAARLTTWLPDWDRSADLRAIDVPTLIATGEYDEVSIDCHETLRDGIRGSQLSIVRGCSHLPMLEAPAIYARLLRSFLD